MQESEFKPLAEIFADAAERTCATPRLFKQMTVREARAFFDAFANHPEVPHGYLRDGCQIRAHIGCRMMQGMGFRPQKAWVVDPGHKDNAKLVLKSEDGVKWHYHVAPAARVMVKPGKSETWIFDPALFDRPVTEKEWKSVYAGAVPHVEYKALGRRPGFGNGDYAPASGMDTCGDTDKDALSWAHDLSALSSARRVSVAVSSLKT